MPKLYMLARLVGRDLAVADSDGRTSKEARTSLNLFAIIPGETSNSTENNISEPIQEWKIY